MSDHKVPTVKHLRAAVEARGEARGRVKLRLETVGGTSVILSTGRPTSPIRILEHVAAGTVYFTGEMIDRRLHDLVKVWSGLDIKQKACAAHAFEYALADRMVEDAVVCEGCAAVLMWDCENVREWSTDNDGVPLCEACMAALVEISEQTDGVSPSSEAGGMA